MPHNEHLCQHLNEIIDEREGSIICTDCGLVLSDLYKNYAYKTTFIHDNAFNTEYSNNEDFKEILEKLNLPTSYADEIKKTYIKRRMGNHAKNKKNKKELIPYAVYSTLNDMKTPISIKEISAVSGFNDSKIYKMQEDNKTISLQPNELLEKYCKMLEFDYKTYSLIKEDLPNTEKTGHNPLTIIGSTIYSHCKRNNLKYSIKKISKIVNISPISIQRYLKLNKQKNQL